MILPSTVVRCAAGQFCTGQVDLKVLPISFLLLFSFPFCFSNGAGTKFKGITGHHENSLRVSLF